MKKVANGFAPLVAVDHRNGTPLHRQIYEGYRTSIWQGNLRPGDRVPSSRELALELGISRLPVLNAYAQLLAEDLLESRRGAGTFVSRVLSGADAVPATPKRKPSHTTPGPRAISRRARVLPAFQPWPWLYGQGSFAVGQVAVDAFPFPLWSRLLSRHFREGRARLLHFGDPMGSLNLRKALATYLRTVRAVNCGPDQLMIVSGSQQALEICARVLFDTGDHVWVEEPSYRLVRHALLAGGCHLVPVQVDQAGLDVASGIRTFCDAQGAIVSPSHQFPLGSIMSVARRRDLLRWAENTGAWIIEDDYDSEYRYHAAPVPSLQGMDSHAGVVYIGTFSKTLFPSLRVGYIVVPEDLIGRFLAVRHAMDMFPPSLYHDVLAEFIEEGHYARHIRRTRVLYQERRDVLVESISNQFGDEIEVLGAEGGLHLTVNLRQVVNDHKVALRAARQKLWLYPLSSSYFGSPQMHGFILGFGNAPTREIPAAVQELKSLLLVANR